MTSFFSTLLVTVVAITTMSSLLTPVVAVAGYECVSTDSNGHSESSLSCDGWCTDQQRNWGCFNPNC